MGPFKRIALNLFVALVVATAVPVDESKTVQLVAFGSCNYHDRPQPIFDHVVRMKADLWLWGGDIQYSDKLPNMRFIHRQATPEILKQHWTELKTHPDYMKLAQNGIPTIGQWDDHDFGKNNIGGEYIHKAESQQLFLDFFDEPQGSPRRKQKGIYTSYTFGQPPKQLKIILVDNRYNREHPALDADILGEEQWTWLENELKNSKAQIHLISSGIQFLTLEKPVIEKWSNFPKSRARLLDLIAKYRVPGVVFLSGDIHWAELVATSCSPVPYRLFEFTSSGMTHSLSTQAPFGLSKVLPRWLLTESKRLHYAIDRNFGAVAIDWEKGTIDLRLFKHTGELEFSYLLSLRDLQFDRNDNQNWQTREDCKPPSFWRQLPHTQFLQLAGLLLFSILVSLCCLCYYCCGCCCFCCCRRKPLPLAGSLKTD